MVGQELEGAKVILRPVRPDDLIRRVEWLNDAEIAKLFTGSVPVRIYGISDAERWRQTLEADIATVVWSIDAKEGQHIGDVDLHSIDHYYGSAKLTILIGDKGFWNRGYGTDTIKTLLKYAFFEMHLTQVELKVYSFNKRGLRCYEKCGFQPVNPWIRTESEMGEVYMIAHKKTLMAENPNAIAV